MGSFYTMSIHRNYEYADNRFENLVICDKRAEKQAYIINYKPDPEYYIRKDQTYHATFIGNMEVSRIDYRAMQKGAITTCTDVTVAYCGNNPGWYCSGSWMLS